MTKILFILLLSQLVTYADNFYYSGGKKHVIKKIKTSRDYQHSNQNSFQTQNGSMLKVNKNLILNYSDKSIKKEIEKRYKLILVKALTDSMFLYSVQDTSKTLEIANKLYKEDGISFCHPDFQRKKKDRAITHDPYSWDAWHLKDEDYHNGSDINIKKAWRYNKGKGVKIAIYDKGIDIEHPDLRANIYAFKNYNDPKTDIPYAVENTKWHGTACAGIIAASENGIGSVGIAPQASIYAIGYSESNISKDIEAFNWLMKEGVSVINNSWGSYSSLDAYTEIFKELATKGRDGKGILLVFASGNEGEDLDKADINDESESEYVISVAASTRKNNIASYSNYGKAIDFTAPGGDSRYGIFTTDARGSKGYTDGDYNKNFVGTSAAAPMVSATIALMIAENPKLTRKDIIKILKFTADQYGDYEYDENGHNIHWGYGKIDAGSAVELAHSYGNSKLKNFARTMFSELLR